MIHNRFLQLPLGNVQARGFLLRQMEMQRDHITGHMEEYPDYSAESGWLGGPGESWERGPYYVRGLVALAYCLRDQHLIQKAKKWIDYALKSQTEDGNFGPQLPFEGMESRREEVQREWWAKMPMLDAIRDYYEAEKALGYDDQRVLPFFDKYFRFQLETLQENPLHDWAVARGADNIELVLWYYDGYKQEDWLLELGHLLLHQTFDWAEEYRNSHVRRHVVNTTQGFKYPYLRYRLTGEDLRGTLEEGLAHIRKDHGRIDDLPNADEAARDNLFTRGTESCAVAEGMLSMEINGCVDGDSRLYDYLETYAYNSLPNCFTYDLSRHCYFQLQNQVMATVGTHGFDCDHGDSCTFGAPTGFDCCFANIHMAYPKFVQNMWQRTEKGLAVVCYGENRIETDFHGRRFGFVQNTRYPYGDQVSLEYTGEAAEFCLSLRVPSWSNGVSVKINGTPVAVYTEKGYIHLEQKFLPEEKIELEFSSSIQVIPWHFHSVAVRKGAILYCLPVGECVQDLEDESPYREIELRAHEHAKTQEIFPMTPWNYALDIKRFIYRENSEPICLTPDHPPCYLKAWGRKDPNWSYEGNIAGHHPSQKLLFREEELEELLLIPYSCTRLKISVFPRLYRLQGNPQRQLVCSASRWAGCIQVDFEIHPEADEMLLLVRDEKDVLYHMPSNSYKGGSFVKKDRFTFSFSETRKVMMQLLAYKNFELIAKSEMFII